MQGKRKSQSAMEYLMTYGWAILAIAIVMVSLYSLGIFNTGSLQPTATPGSCEVVRTAAQTSLAGQCSNLIPKYVGKFNSKAWIAINNSRNLAVSGNLTITAWIYTPLKGRYTIISKYGGGEFYEYSFTTDNVYCTSSAPCLLLYGGNGVNNQADYPSSGYPLSTWTFVSVTRQVPGACYKINFTFNGIDPGTNGCAGISSASSYPVTMGALTAGLSEWNYNGSMANVQVYNTTLDNSTIKALYQEGIGGAPIEVQHLVGWWPLNGNANDYSGNNNNGVPTNVIWNANWQSGYTAPTS